MAEKGDIGPVSKNDQTTNARAVSIAQDVHVMDIYRQVLSLGFYPLTETERSGFGLANFSTWMSYAFIRQDMYKLYKESLNSIIKETNLLYFTNYLRNKISNLSALTEQDKETLLDKLIYCSDGERTMEGFYRLFFVMQGILKVKSSPEWDKIPDAWEEITEQIFEELSALEKELELEEARGVQEVAMLREDWEIL